MGFRRPVTTALSVGVIGLTVAVGVLVWPRLPAEIVTQFSASGTPTTTVSKPVGVFLFPAIIVLLVAVLRGAFRVDPPDDPQLEAVTELSTVCVLSAVHLSVLAWNLGYPISMDLVTLGILLWAAVFVGYVIVRERDLSIP